MSTLPISGLSITRPAKRIVWRVLEVILWIAGVGLLLTYGIVRTWSFQQQQEGLEKFAAARIQESAGAITVPATIPVFASARPLLVVSTARPGLRRRQCPEDAPWRAAHPVHRIGGADL